MKTILIPAGRTQKNLARLTKWAGFHHDFSGGLESVKWYGHKIAMRNGSIVVNLWPRRYLNANGQVTIKGID